MQKDNVIIRIQFVWFDKFYSEMCNIAFSSYFSLIYNLVRSA
jgi:hypothetical protein